MGQKGVDDMNELIEQIRLDIRSSTVIQLVGTSEQGKGVVEKVVPDLPLLTVDGINATDEEAVAGQLYDDLQSHKAQLSPELRPSENQRPKGTDQAWFQTRRVNDVLEEGEAAILYDAFNEMPPGIQVYAAQRIKLQYERGSTIFVRSEPSEQGYLTMRNGDLIGRVRTFEIAEYQADAQ